MKKEVRYGVQCCDRWFRTAGEGERHMERSKRTAKHCVLDGLMGPANMASVGLEGGASQPRSMNSEDWREVSRDIARERQAFEQEQATKRSQPTPDVNAEMLGALKLVRAATLCTKGGGIDVKDCTCVHHTAARVVARIERAVKGKG